MATQTVELNFADHIAEIDGDADTSEWTATLELDVKWHGAEPDVGITERQPELVGVTYYWDGDTFTDDAGFAAAVYATIGGDIEIGEDELLALIRRFENELDLEEDQ